MAAYLIPLFEERWVTVHAMQSWAYLYSHILPYPHTGPKFCVWECEVQMENAMAPLYSGHICDSLAQGPLFQRKFCTHLYVAGTVGAVLIRELP